MKEALSTKVAQLVCVLVMACTGRAVAVLQGIASINADGVDTSFSHVTRVVRVKQSKVGVEAKKKNRKSDIHSSASVAVVPTLDSWGGTSSAILASGAFREAALTTTDSDGTELLPKDSVSIATREVDMTIGATVVSHYVLLSGNFQAVGGVWQPNFSSAAEVVSIEFGLLEDPDDLENTSFSGQSKVMMTATPEPATLMLLALAAPLLYRRKKNISATN